MKLSISRNLFGIVTLALLMIVGISAEAMGQGRGRRVSHLGKKCAKFVNCHDARDGRVDGRGPNRSVSNIFRRTRRNRDLDGRIRHRRHENRDIERGRGHGRR